MTEQNDHRDSFKEKATIPMRVACYVLYAFCLIVPVIFWNGLPTAVAIKQYIGQSLVLLMLLPLSIEVVRAIEVPFPAHLVSLCILLYVFYLGASSFFHLATDASVLSGNILSCLLFFEVVIIAKEEAVVRKCIICLCTGGSVVSGYYLLQFFGHDMVVWQWPINGDSSIVWKGSTFSNRNLMVCFLVSVFPFTIYLMQSRNPLSKIISGVAGVLVLLTLTLCHSRVAIVILALTAPAYLYYASVNVGSSKIKAVLRSVLITLCVCLFAGIVAALCLMSRMTPEQVNTLFHARLTLWTDTLRLIADSPVFGHGAGSFPRVFAAFQSDELGYLFPFDQAVFFSHNEMLEILVESGILGLVLFAGFVFASTIHLVSLGVRNLAKNPLLFFSSVSLAGSFVFSLVGEACHLFICSAFSWIVLALCNSAQSISKKTGYLKPVNQRWVRAAIPAVVCIAVTILMVMQVRLFLSDMFLQKAIYAISQSPETSDFSGIIANLDTSYKFNRNNLYTQYQSAYIATQKNDLTTALSLYAEIQRTAPFFENTQYNKGAIYYLQKKYQKAIDTLLVAHHRYPTFKKSMYYLACSYFELEDWKACELWCGRFKQFDSASARITMMSDWSRKKLSGW